MKNMNSQSFLLRSFGPWPFAVALFISLPWVARSATMTYVGSETGTAAEWSNSGVSKTYDWNGSNVYGSSGYVQIRPTLLPATSNVFESAGSGNDLGATKSVSPTLLVKPSYISSLTGSAGNFVNFNGYATYKGPGGTNEYRQGALSVNLNQGPWSIDGRPSSYAGFALSFTVDPGAHFRIGLGVDSVGGAQYAPDYVGLYAPTLATTTLISAALTRDAIPDIAFFDINTTSDTAAVSFTVSLWQKDVGQGNASPAALSLVTFDTIPEPSTGLLLLVGMGCLAIRSRRR